MKVFSKKWNLGLLVSLSLLGAGWTIAQEGSPIEAFQEALNRLGVGIVDGASEMDPVQRREAARAKLEELDQLVDRANAIASQIQDPDLKQEAELRIRESQLVRNRIRLENQLQDLEATGRAVAEAIADLRRAREEFEEVAARAEDPTDFMPTPREEPVIAEASASEEGYIWTPGGLRRMPETGGLALEPEVAQPDSCYQLEAVEEPQMTFVVAGPSGTGVWVPRSLIADGALQTVAEPLEAVATGEIDEADLLIEEAEESVDLSISGDQFRTSWRSIGSLFGLSRDLTQSGIAQVGDGLSRGYGSFLNGLRRIRPSEAMASLEVAASSQSAPVSAMPRGIATVIQATILGSVRAERELQNPGLASSEVVEVGLSGEWTGSICPGDQIASSTSLFDQNQAVERDEDVQQTSVEAGSGR